MKEKIRVSAYLTIGPFPKRALDLFDHNRVFILGRKDDKWGDCIHKSKVLRLMDSWRISSFSFTKILPPKKGRLEDIYRSLNEASNYQVYMCSPKGRSRITFFAAYWRYRKGWDSSAEESWAYARKLGCNFWWRRAFLKACSEASHVA